MMKSGVLFLFGFATLATGQRTITINGGWSPWSTVATPCLRENSFGNFVPVTCGGGKMTRRRSCTNPVPQGIRPKLCEGNTEMHEDCKTDPCDMQWSQWSECSANCGRGSRQRQTMCAFESGGVLKTCKELGLKEQDFEHIEECNTWNKEKCPSPCIGYNCMDFAACLDVSTEEDPETSCECQLGRIMNKKKDACIVPPQTTPTPRPIPTLAPAVKTATSAVTKSASSVLIVFVGITLFLFASLRVYDHARVIQMNMEIALICAHICLLLPDMTDIPDACRIVSVLIHFFFTTTFMFMFLESLHTYSIVAFVVKRNGVLSRFQNILIGWGLSVAVVLIVVALQWDNYGGEYHCWLQVNTPLMFGQIIPIVVLVILIFTMIEAAGVAEYRRLPGMDQQQLLSAKIMQRTNLVIMPMVFISFIIGAMSEYEQNVPLYGTFTVLNGFLGAAVFFFHSTGNEQVREKLQNVYSSILKKE